MSLGLDMLDVAIGVVFVFLMISLIASAIAELIEVWLKRRATDLENGIRELLANNDNLVAALYDHPLILSLYKGSSYASAKASGNLPSYVPAQNFALAAFDLLFPQSTTPPADDKIAQNMVQMTDDLQKYVDAHPASGKKLTLDDLGPKLATLVLNIIKDAQGDAAKIRKSLEDWFNATMDRVSGWYKRWNQKILIVIGALLAIIFNVDTIAITQALSVNKSLRDAAVQTAVDYSKSQDAATTTTTTGTSSPAPQPKSGTDAETPTEKQLRQRIHDYSSMFMSLGLPIGWTAEWKTWKETSTDWWDYWGPVVLGHLLGWLITAFAVSLGAPFWFDTLNKIIVIRSTVKPQEKSGTEAAKDPQKKPQTT
jgi:hypothetical protein